MTTRQSVKRAAELAAVFAARFGRGRWEADHYHDKAGNPVTVVKWRTGPHKGRVVAKLWDLDLAEAVALVPDLLSLAHREARRDGG